MTLLYEWKEVHNTEVPQYQGVHFVYLLKQFWDIASQLKRRKAERLLFWAKPSETEDGERNWQIACPSYLCYVFLLEVDVSVKCLYRIHGERTRRRLEGRFKKSPAWYVCNGKDLDTSRGRGPQVTTTHTWVCVHTCTITYTYDGDVQWQEDSYPHTSPPDMGDIICMGNICVLPLHPLL